MFPQGQRPPDYAEVDEHIALSSLPTPPSSSSRLRQQSSDGRNEVRPGGQKEAEIDAGHCPPL
jgi:hypothetical protein